MAVQSALFHVADEATLYGADRIVINYMRNLHNDVAWWNGPSAAVATSVVFPRLKLRFVLSVTLPALFLSTLSLLPSTPLLQPP